MATARQRGRVDQALRGNGFWDGYLPQSADAGPVAWAAATENNLSAIHQGLPRGTGAGTGAGQVADIAILAVICFVNVAARLILDTITTVRDEQLNRANICADISTGVVHMRYDWVQAMSAASPGTLTAPRGGAPVQLQAGQGGGQLNALPTRLGAASRKIGAHSGII